MVKNRCKNGNHYWVDAYVTPVYEGETLIGYQSVRTKPTRDQIHKAERLYARIRERKLEALPKRLIPEFGHGVWITAAFVLVGLGAVIAGWMGSAWVGLASLLDRSDPGAISVGASSCPLKRVSSPLRRSPPAI